MADSDPTRPTPNLESRVAKLEATTESILRELLEMRLDIRELRVDMREMRAEMRSDFRWLLGLYITGWAALLGVLAHGFHWL